MFAGLADGRVVRLGPQADRVVELRRFEGPVQSLIGIPARAFASGDPAVDVLLAGTEKLHLLDPKSWR